ncbi:MAG: M67 family metallopeptidase [Armatimonadetes bacterium]|nr:M67 family metallopeptidase [Armatimonadota bacterium]
MIVIPLNILNDMVEHAREQAPLEACGLLVGQNAEVKKSYRLTNMDASSEHFSLDPKEQFAVVKEIRPNGWDVLAVYHSHPATPARMSEEDLRLALAPEMRYVIVSLMDDEWPKVKSFTVRDGQAVEEPVSTEESQ